MLKLLRFVIATLLLCAAGSAFGAEQWVLLDDFNRTPSNPFDLGLNWTQHTSPPRFEIVNNQVAGSGDFNALMTYNDYISWAIRFDIHHDDDGIVGSAQYVAAILEYDEAPASSYLQVGLVDNGLGMFHKIHFCDQTGLAWPGMGKDLPIEDLPLRFKDAQVTVSFKSLDEKLGQVTVDVDTDSDGDPELSYVRQNTPVIISKAKGVGLKTFGKSKVDNFRVKVVPEPSALILLSLGGIALMRRNQRRW